MTPALLATIHAAAFEVDRPWGAAEFASLLIAPHTSLFTASGGFALARTVARESELLTLAVSPNHQRHGIGNRLMRDWLDAAMPHADTAFLEVASDNIGAIALYHAWGFTQSGLRRGYYIRKTGENADAIAMNRDLRAP